MIETGSTLQRSLLGAEAVQFLIDLDREFRDGRRDILDARRRTQGELARGLRPGFLESTASIRGSDWKVASAPPDLADRRVEITGPVEAKMMINALNSGARVFMADFEDATTPTWPNLLQGQANLVAAYLGSLRFQGEEKSYELGGRGGDARGPAPRLASRREAFPRGRQADVGVALRLRALSVPRRQGRPRQRDRPLLLPAQAGVPPRGPAVERGVRLPPRTGSGIPSGTIRATVLIETILAAFEMDEILYELRDHSPGSTPAAGTTSSR